MTTAGAADGIPGGEDVIGDNLRYVWDPARSYLIVAIPLEDGVELSLRTGTGAGGC